MSKNTFITLVREYRALAARKQVSYADAVLAAQRIYIRSAGDGDEHADEREERTIFSREFINREYAPTDRVVFERLL